MRHYEGLGDDFNQSSIYWNGSLGYKFLENEAAEVRVTLFDILGQNDNITRSISDDYIEDYRSNVLTRYFIMTFSYNFRAFGRKGPGNKDTPLTGDFLVVSISWIPNARRSGCRSTF